MVEKQVTTTMGGMEFKDISNEMYREYDFGGGCIYRIEHPHWLHVKRQTETQHSHRILDKAGVSHYIPSGWIGLRWSSPTGQEFSF